MPNSSQIAREEDDGLRGVVLEMLANRRRWLLSGATDAQKALLKVEINVLESALAGAGLSKIGEKVERDLLENLL